MACVEFEAGAGLWTAVRFASEMAESVWTDRIQAAFRLLADSGFGARRSSGWGQAAAPEFQSGAWPQLLMPKLKLGRNGAGNGSARLYWLLSLYSPAASDSVDWSGGFYEVAVRGGRVESPAASGAPKKQIRLIAEGSVLSANSDLIGAAVDVAADGFAHPVYRSGLVLAIPLPALELKPEPLFEEPPVTEAFDNLEASVRDEEPPAPTPEPVPEEPMEPIREPEVLPEEPQPEEPTEPIEPPMEPPVEPPPIEEPESEIHPVTEPIPEAGDDPQPDAPSEEGSFDI
jgi:hypothetical protein